MIQGCGYVETWTWAKLVGIENKQIMAQHQNISS